MIRIPQVRVVDEEGTQLGVMPTPRALEMAQERGFDLVEVAPMASPPVVKFLDFGQYKYELTKREKEAKRRQRAVTFKEVRLTPKIGSGDFLTKVHRAVEFLEELVSLDRFPRTQHCEIRVDPRRKTEPADLKAADGLPVDPDAGGYEQEKENSYGPRDRAEERTT